MNNATKTAEALLTNRGYRVGNGPWANFSHAEVADAVKRHGDKAIDTLVARYEATLAITAELEVQDE
jgi:hypothetical protein